MARKTKQEAAPQGAAAGAKFPAKFRIFNKTPIRAAFPVIDAIIPSGGSVVIEVESADRLEKFAKDAEQICLVNGFAEGFEAVAYDAEAEAKAEADAKAKAEADAKAKAEAEAKTGGE